MENQFFFFGLMMLNRFIKWVGGFTSFDNDPVKQCNVYKRVGCSHVDGPLCQMKTCDIVVKDHSGSNSVIIIKPRTVVSTVDTLAR